MAAYLATASVGDYVVNEYVAANGTPDLRRRRSDAARQPRRRASRSRATCSCSSRGCTAPTPSTPTGRSSTTTRSATRSRPRPVRSSREPRREGTVAHELAHQWMGDHVSPYRWADIWLNEGWATYSTWMWTEHRGGDTAQAAFDDVPVDSGRRRGMGRRRRRPRPARTVPQPDLRPRRRHAARAARRDRRRRLLRAGADLGRAVRRRHGIDRRLHRPAAGGVGPGPRRVLRRVALHAREAGRLVAAVSVRRRGGRPRRRSRRMPRHPSLRASARARRSAGRSGRAVWRRAASCAWP